MNGNDNGYIKNKEKEKARQKMYLNVIKSFLIGNVEVIKDDS